MVVQVRPLPSGRCADGSSRCLQVLQRGRKCNRDGELGPVDKSNRCAKCRAYFTLPNVLCAMIESYMLPFLFFLANGNVALCLAIWLGCKGMPHSFVVQQFTNWNPASSQITINTPTVQLNTDISNLKGIAN